MSYVGKCCLKTITLLIKIVGKISLSKLGFIDINTGI